MSQVALQHALGNSTWGGLSRRSWKPSLVDSWRASFSYCSRANLQEMYLFSFGLFYFVFGNITWSRFMLSHGENTTLHSFKKFISHVILISLVTVWLMMAGKHLRQFYHDFCIGKFKARSDDKKYNGYLPNAYCMTGIILRAFQRAVSSGTELFLLHFTDGATETQGG